MSKKGDARWAWDARRGAEGDTMGMPNRNGGWERNAVF